MKDWEKHLLRVAIQVMVGWLIGLLLLVAVIVLVNNAPLLVDFLIQ